MVGIDLFGIYLEIIRGQNGHLAIRHSIDIPTYVAVFCILNYTSHKIVYRRRPLSTWHGIHLGWWWRRWPVHVEGSCIYIEQVMGGGPLAWVLGKVQAAPHLKKLICYIMLTKPLTWTGTSD